MVGMWGRMRVSGKGEVPEKDEGGMSGVFTRVFTRNSRDFEKWGVFEEKWEGALKNWGFNGENSGF